MRAIRTALLVATACALCAVVVVACRAPGTCAANGDCRSDERCSDGACAQVCSADVECRDDEACLDGLCAQRPVDEDGGRGVDGGEAGDDGGRDAGADAGRDAGSPDAGLVGDAGSIDDAGGPDAGAVDDAGATDDAGTIDAGAAVCGDGVVEDDEACDDGNVFILDGCAAGCAIEAGFACFRAPSVCAPIETVLHVYPDAGSLQTTVETSPDGSTIVVHGGTWLNEGFTVASGTKTVVGLDGAWVIETSGFGAVSVDGDTTSLRLVGLRIEAGGGVDYAIEQQRGVLVVEDCLLGPAGQYVLRVKDADATVRRSTLTQGREGGLRVENATALVESSFIIGNGDGTTGTAGVHTQQGTTTLRHVTLAGNVATPGAIGGSVRCGVDSVIERSIVWQSGGATEVSGCGPVDSAVFATDGGVDPGFVDADGGDFHLLPGSALAQRHAATATTPLLDVDGQPRVLGGLVEIGADEVP